MSKPMPSKSTKAPPRAVAPATRTGRPMKSDAERKDDLIRVRVNDEQKRTLTAAADRAGLDVSSWLRTIGLREAAATSQVG